MCHLQYATIQAGIDAANNVDTVFVEDGIYTGANNKNLSWIGKHITVRLQNKVENCITGDTFVRWNSKRR
jgi:hypothetical protein